LQNRRHEYFEHFNFVIIVGFVTFVCIFLLHAINMDDVSMFTDSLFSVLVILNLYYTIIRSIK
jgi:hypothetical protein